MVIAWVVWLVVMALVYLNVDRWPRWLVWPALVAAVSVQFGLLA
jgi:hypothetical protein